MPYPESRSALSASGMPAEMRDRERAIEYARKAVALFGDADLDLANLARQYLRTLGLPEKI